MFEHIKNMLWTTVPAFILSAILFAVLSPKQAAIDLSQIDELKTTLKSLNLVHLYSFIPFLILLILAIKKVPAVITLSLSTLAALFVAFFIDQGLNAQNLLELLYSGFHIDSGVAEIDQLLGGGGIESMLFSISLSSLPCH